MTKKKLETLNVSFQIVNIEIIEICFHDREEHSKTFATAPLSQIDFLYEISLNLDADIQKNLFLVTPTISIMNPERTITFAYVKTKCFFSVNNLSTFVKNNSLQIPDSLRDRMSSISISTSRGIMFCELKGSYLNNAILPIIDVANFDYKPIV